MHRPPKDCSPGVIQKPEFSGKQKKNQNRAIREIRAKKCHILRLARDFIIVSITRSKSPFSIAVPDGKHSPRSNKSSATSPPTTRHNVGRWSSDFSSIPPFLHPSPITFCAFCAFLRPIFASPLCAFAREISLPSPILRILRFFAAINLCGSVANSHGFLLDIFSLICIIHICIIHYSEIIKER